MVSKEKFTEQEQALGRRITVFGRNVYVTDAMKNYAFNKLEKIDRFHNHIMDIHVTLDLQKIECSCVIILKLDHVRIKVGSSSTDMYVSIDRAVDKLQTQVRRWKSRIQDHHKLGRSVVDMQVNVIKRPFTDIDLINEAIELETLSREAENYQMPQVVGQETYPLKTLTTEEAIMKMELSSDPFMPFRGEEDKVLKVIHRREDGNYGLIVLK